jgi:hypothetical protein
VRIFLALAALSLAGCYASHELPDGGAPPPDAPFAACLAPSASRAAVTVEAMGADATACALPMHVESAALTHIEREPRVNGIRIRADLCPDADADCECDIVVAAIGSDAARGAGSSSLVTIDLDASHVSITTAPTCTCAGCPCGHSLVFYAADADPESARAIPPDVAFGVGDRVCPSDGDCMPGSWRLRVRTEAGAVEVDQGIDRVLGAVTIRGLRDVDVYNPCGRCAICGSHRGSWAAWVVR